MFKPLTIHDASDAYQYQDRPQVVFDHSGQAWLVQVDRNGNIRGGSQTTVTLHRFEWEEEEKHEPANGSGTPAPHLARR